LTGEKLDQEVKRGAGVVAVADQIIRNASVQLQAAKLVSDHGFDPTPHLPEVIGKAKAVKQIEGKAIAAPGEAPMTRAARIPYSPAEMRWLEENRLMVIGDYHRAFVEAFGRADVTAAHLHGLRKRKGWKVGPELARGRMLGRHTKYSADEVAWLRDNCTMVIGDYHRALLRRFERSDMTARAARLRKNMGWKTGRDGHLQQGPVPVEQGQEDRQQPRLGADAVQEGPAPAQHQVRRPRARRRRSAT
jgi:hypothetical protein